MTTEFQFVCDRAEQISIDRHPIVAQTMTRSGVVRAVSRGSKPWTFTVKLPDGIPWTELRTLIAAAEVVDRFTTTTIAFSNSGYSTWLGNTVGLSGQTFNVICTSFPKWTIGARNQTMWDGPFVFQQVVA
jgi:hypothetical protein